MTPIDVPTLNDSSTNKQATQNGSLYHICRFVLQAISTIPSLQPYLTMCDSMAASTSTPMSRLWHFCRQGTSLCILFNTLQPDTPIPLHAEQQALSITTAQKPKAYVYHFIIACRDQLHFSPDTLFTLKDVFQDDTNGFVRVRKRHKGKPH
jgi:cell division control protein 24